LVAAFAGVAASAGYGLVLTPTLEERALFERLGSSTEVVRKEMYELTDRGGRRLALRPETTASVARAYIEHKPPLPWKAWYAGSQFREERPQAGRYREFHQLGIEAFGSADPDLDVEVVALGWEFLAGIGLDRVELLVNSLGDHNCRPAYREKLIAFLEERSDRLCEEHRQRFMDNPLRVLDCKKSPCREATASAPVQLDHLCEPCQRHFARVRAGLESLGIPLTVEPRLVRGLDYYTRTAFEYAGGALASAQNALGGGGRYDGLVEALGGPATPAVGFALGVERILAQAAAEQRLEELAGRRGRTEVFVVDLTGGEAARDLTARLREGGIRADRAFDSRSAKAQMRAASSSGARLAVVVGADELAKGTVGIRDLAAGEQDSVPASAVVEQVRRRLGR
jgi:histidyl-tRNA synthetase